MIFCKAPEVKQQNIRRLGWLTRRWISRACLLVVLVGPLAIAADEAPKEKCLDARNDPDQLALNYTPTVDNPTEMLSLASSIEVLRLPAKNGSMRVTFSDVVQYVQQHGWRADLGDMCTKFELPRSGNDCIFRQLSLQDQREADSDPRGFNVPAVWNTGPHYVLIFHLRPLVGEFFIVSPDGILVRAYLRFKGTDYSLVPNEEVQQEFDKNFAYWTTNFSRLKKALEAERPGQK